MQSVFPIAYFGSIAYYKELVSAENPIFEQWETYPKHSLRNHCEILTPNGVLDLIVPLRKVNGSKTITKDVRVDYTTDWTKKHWRTFVSGYSSSPYFDHYGMEIEEILNQKHEFLIDLSQLVHEKINIWLDLKVPFQLTDNFEKENIQDFRNAFKTRKLQAEYKYQQVFALKENFVPDLSILDAIFNLGPMARKLLKD